MLGPQIGFGPIWLQQPRSKFLRCSELHTQPCDVEATDQCCAVIPCTYCLRLESYGQTGDDAPFGLAEFDTDSWSGTVGGHLVTLYWRRNQYTGACEFAVLFDAEEVAAVDCESGSCRDSSGSADVGEDRTLFWERLVSHPLKYRKDDDGCTTWFCGSCECTCQELCARVGRFVGTLSIDPYASECDPPVWSGEVETATETIEAELYLYRGDYDGGCYLAGQVRGESVGPVLITDCKQINVTFELYDGLIVQITCKECGCPVDQVCTKGCCYPHQHNTPVGDVMLPIPFEISAPGCYEANGYQGVFQPIGIGFNPASRCGTCNYYESDDQIAIQASGLVNSGLSCLPSPVVLRFCFGLECLGADENACCEGIRLLVGSIYPFAGATYEPDSPFGSLCPWIRRIAPLTCLCSDEDGFSDHDKNGFSAVYPLDSLSFACDETYTDGVCAGQSICPTPLACSFAGATLSI